MDLIFNADLKINIPLSSKNMLCENVWTSLLIINYDYYHPLDGMHNRTV
jgi:hypothetical protein